MSYSDVARRRESDRERAKRYRGRKGVTEGVTEGVTVIGGMHE